MRSCKTINERSSSAAASTSCYSRMICLRDCCFLTPQFSRTSMIPKAKGNTATKIVDKIPDTTTCLLLMCILLPAGCRRFAAVRERAGVVIPHHATLGGCATGVVFPGQCPVKRNKTFRAHRDDEQDRQRSATAARPRAPTTTSRGRLPQNCYVVLDHTSLGQSR